jgi:hypothetical protein
VCSDTHELVKIGLSDYYCESGVHLPSSAFLTSHRYYVGSLLCSADIPKVDVKFEADPIRLRKEQEELEEEDEDDIYNHSPNIYMFFQYFALYS